MTKEAYKYTHERAIADGALFLVESIPYPTAQGITVVKIYASPNMVNSPNLKAFIKEAKGQMPKNVHCPWGGPHIMLNGPDRYISYGLEIRDDDQLHNCITIYEPGER